MIKRDWWVAAAAAAALAVANGQTAKPKEDAAAAEAAAAMERARKQAANPMRIILEAAKSKRDGPAAAAETSVRPVVNRSAAPAPNPAPNPAPAVAAAAVAAAPAAAPVPTPAAEPPPAPSAKLSSEVLQSRASQPVAALAPTGTAAVNAAPLGATPVATPALEVALARPQLVKMVEPDVPQRILDDLGRNATVAVDMMVRADGSVGDVTLAGPAPRGLQRVLASALQQWRFAAMPAERKHRVELVFNADR